MAPSLSSLSRYILNHLPSVNQKENKFTAATIFTDSSHPIKLDSLNNLLDSLYCDEKSEELSDSSSSDTASKKSYDSSCSDQSSCSSGLNVNANNNNNHSSLPDCLLCPSCHFCTSFLCTKCRGIRCTLCDAIQSTLALSSGTERQSCPAAALHFCAKHYKCLGVVKENARCKVCSIEGADGDEEPDVELDVSAGTILPAIRKKEREYMGMLEFDKKDDANIIKILLYELKPRIAVTLLPGMPAYILFMCIRHADHFNDDEKVRSLMNHTLNGFKRLIRKRQNNLDSNILWMSNTLRLLHNLKQYSGDKAFQQENTTRQNEQSLKNFDLSEYRQVLSDIVVWMYNYVIKIMEESIQPLVVPSILENEAIAGLSGNKPGGRGRTTSTSKEIDSPDEPQKALDQLLTKLTHFYRTLAMFGTDPELIQQVFRQIFYYINAGALNNLLLRKDMCHWSKGMQIRFNLTNLEQWTRDMKLNESATTDTLAPILQAAQLLQHRKTDDDVGSICEMCDKLTVPQIIKILNLYTPADEFEERVPASFIQKIQIRLKERSDTEQGQNTLLVSTKFLFPIRFPFNPSSIRLEDLELPEVLNLTMLKRV